MNSKASLRLHKLQSSFSNKNLIYVLLFIAVMSTSISCSHRSTADNLQINNDNQNTPSLYSSKGIEVQASYTAYYRTKIQDLNVYNSMTEKQKKNSVAITKTTTYLYGPLTYRELGAPSKREAADIKWDEARIGNTGFVEIPYTYQGKWLLKNTVSEGLTIPVPYNLEALKTPGWLKCTDEEPTHQSESLLWYFWDPSRKGCDHALGEQYQLVQVSFLDKTVPTTQSFPEYDQLLKSDGKDNNFQMTFGFGYVEKLADPNPDKDSDPAAIAYRNFAITVRQYLADYRFTESPILEKEYLSAKNPDKKIGTRFQGIKDNVQVTINLVMAIDIDQIEIFAKSFAHDHDGFFAWFGHSRIGEGFAVSQLKKIMAKNQDYYQIKPNYQIIYWGGCNSYSYFTTPFFNLKAEINPTNDPNGTKGLDIISNGLPAIAQQSEANAKTIFSALINWQKNFSYQQIIDKIQKNSETLFRKDTTLINVLGDEDNQPVQ